MQQRRIVGDDFEFAVIVGENLYFPAHSHDEMVISANAIGNEILSLDGREMEAPEGETTLFNPGQMHEGRGTNCIVSLYIQETYFQRNNLHHAPLSFDQASVADPDLIYWLRNMISPILNRISVAEADEEAVGIISLITNRYTIATLDTTPSVDDWRVARVMTKLLDELHYIPTLDELAREVDLSKSALRRLFIKSTGLPPIRWQREHRLAKARKLLRAGWSPLAVSVELGFADQAHLTRAFGKNYGLPPARFQRGV